jgi:hypothetical protein
MAPALVVTVADTHTNSRYGLVSPFCEFDTGAQYQQSPEQKWLWDKWLELCQDINSLAHRRQARVIVVFNGDGPDRNRYSGGYDLISLSRAEIVRWTVDTLQPLRDVADVFIVNRGTPAHEGGTGELAELVAERLEATKRGRSWSWWDVELVVEGVRFYFGHRPISNSHREHTRGNGAKRTAFDLWAAYHRMDDPCPDVFVFSHVHHWAEGKHLDTLCVYTHPWKLCDSYGHSMGFGAKVEPVGAWLFLCEHDDYNKPIRWERQPPRTSAIMA